ncbi:MAG: acetoin utilization deacetylase AcuC-like enzyme [Candidatus Azotimanducaceae bacterium]|jgi:acetoin utilization deacetylase AcuC-like enzyme
MDELTRSGIRADMKEVMTSEISDEDVLRVHPKTYLKHIETSEPAGAVIKVDPDTYMSRGSTHAAKLAAGAVAEATTRVLNGEANRAFCAIRPPGHHAEIASAFGFCLFNSVAICDFDVHHCNGTVDFFKDRPEVLVCSSFQNHFYPHRYLDFSNDHIIITPLYSGTNSKSFRALIERDWIPTIEKHKLDLIFVSAGFDVHKDDPLAEVCLEDDDFRWISRLLVDLSNQYAKGRLTSSLEGGDELDALARSAKLHVVPMG